MNKQFIAFLIVLLGLSALSLQSKAQLIVATKSGSKELKHIYPGATLKLRYRGYLNQEETLKGRLAGVDSLIYLSVSDGLFRRKLIAIRPIDVTGFRRYSLGRQLLEPMVKLTVAIGSLVATAQLQKHDKLSGSQTVWFTAGVNLITQFGIDPLFPNRINADVQDGWQLYLIPEGKAKPE